MRRTCAAAIAILCGLAGAGAQAADYRVLHRFSGGDDGDHPMASLLDVGGTLYGTTYGDFKYTPEPYPGQFGTVFAMNPATGASRTVHSFTGGDGAYPFAGLIQVGGTLYGTTRINGAGAGTVFALNPRTGSEKVVYAFHGLGGDYYPAAGLINIGGTLFGTLAYGGVDIGPTFTNGKVFRLNPATGIEKTLHAFQGGSDGAGPGDLVDVGGTLYGTTSEGGGANPALCGQFGCGTVFSVDSRTGVEHVVYAFQGGADGSRPVAGLIDVGGLLFGTTYDGGLIQTGNPFRGGTVFAVDPKSGVERVVYRFRCGTDGCNPGASLLDVGGTLYGTTTSGGGTGLGCGYYGTFGCGTVFSLNPATGAEQVLHAFLGGNDGAVPGAGLIDVAGTLYGTTEAGGHGTALAIGHGTVFALTP